MIKKILSIIFSLVLVSCGSSKKAASTNTKKNTANSVNETVSLADKVVWTAVTYKGTPYKYAGTTKAGMDCSGLIHTAFKQRNVVIPRTSSQMYNTTGKSIRLSQVKRGDLLFFKTKNKRGKVNHVGLVTSVKNGDIRFIHSTTSKGVIVSSLNSRYWNNAFVGCKRVL